MVFKIEVLCKNQKIRLSFLIVGLPFQDAFPCTPSGAVWTGEEDVPSRLSFLLSGHQCRCALSGLAKPAQMCGPACAGLWWGLWREDKVRIYSGSGPSPVLTMWLVLSTWEREALPLRAPNPSWVQSLERFLCQSISNTPPGAEKNVCPQGRQFSFPNNSLRL